MGQSLYRATYDAVAAHLTTAFDTAAAELQRCRGRSARQWRGAWPDASARRVAAGSLVSAFVLASLGAAALGTRSSASSPSRLVTVRAASLAAATPVPQPKLGVVPPTPAPVVVATPARPAPAPAARTGFVPAAAARDSLPLGKGMWLWQPAKAEGGNVAAIVAKARAVGLTHLYVRTGSTWDGFNEAPFLSKILPAAHKAGLKVFGWDFPRLITWQADVNRALLAINFRAPGGHSIDGFAADIETASEGTKITGARALAYGHNLRQIVGADYPLIAVVPHPSPQRIAAGFPYRDVVARFDAVAPMVYWLNREPGSDVERAVRILSQYGKPVFPIGQAYDGKAEGGRPGVPPPAELLRFMAFAARNGAAGVSFWSWQHANAPAWEAIHQAPYFRLTDLLPGPLHVTPSKPT